MTEPTTFPSVTSLIRFDHTHVVALFHRFKRGTSLARRQAIGENVCLALEIHAQLEEEIFYPALRSVSGMEGLLDKSAADHDEVRRLISALRAAAPADATYDSAFRELLRAVLHHVADEETLVLPAAEERLEADLGRLGRQFAKRKLELLRPHAAEVARTTIFSFPLASAALAVGMLGLGLWVRQRSGRAV